MTKTIFRVLSCGLLPLLLFSCGGQTRNVQTPQNEQENFDEDVLKEEIHNVSSGIINGHEWVDLGLPSGLKWATCNIGASAPELYGSYFAWGETRTKTSFTEENIETYDKDNQWLRSNGYLDSGGNLSLSHDAAHQNWGGTWRMPKSYEIKELENNTSTEWTTLNGVKGRLVKSRKNGNSIFLPAAGWAGSSSVDCAGDYGSYWSSTPFWEDPEYAYSLFFYSADFGFNWMSRSFGRSVRPVSE